MTFLREVQTLLERTYAPVPIELETCLIGEQRCAALNHLAGESAQGLAPGGRTFVRIAGDSLHLAIYFSPGLIARLESDDPRQRINERNIAPLITFIEEIAHAVQAALLFLEGERVMGSEEFLCNLETQARIDTYLVLSHLVHTLTGEPIPRRVGVWLRRQVFDDSPGRFALPRLRLRYGQAQRWARRFLRRLRQHPPGERVPELRRFRALPWDKKRLDLAEGVPAARPGRLRSPTPCAIPSV